MEATTKIKWAIGTALLIIVRFVDAKASAALLKDEPAYDPYDDYGCTNRRRATGLLEIEESFRQQNRRVMKEYVRVTNQLPASERQMMRELWMATYSMYNCSDEEKPEAKNKRDAFRAQIEKRYGCF